LNIGRKNFLTLTWINHAAAWKFNIMRKIIKSIDRILMQVEDWSLFIAVSIALVVAMANIILRKLTSEFSLYWSDEVVRKVVYISAYIGCVAAIRGRTHIRIDALQQFFPALRRPFYFILNLSILVFGGYMLYSGWGLALMMYKDEYAKTISLRLPEWWFYSVLPTMGALVILRTLIVLVEDWIGKQEALDKQEG
jgi:TRAP-type C4-dicarboxylate transport system permease small subunit